MLCCASSSTVSDSDGGTTEGALDAFVKCLLATVLPTVLGFQDEHCHCFFVILIGVGTLESSIVRGPVHADNGAVPGVLKSGIAHLAEFAVDFAGEGGHWVGSLWYEYIMA